jgi:hypothetical protein
VFLALFVNVTLVWSKAVDLQQQQVAFPNDDGSSNKREKKSLENYAQPGLQ